jgi:hypothetical protein
VYRVKKDDLMDLALHSRVLSRHRLLVGAGLVIAVLLAFLAYVRVSPEGISYRQQEKWQSVARLFATQGGHLFSPPASSTSTASIDPTSFALLATQFANSDAVKRALRREGKVNGEVVASVGKVEGTFLPFVEVAGIAPTPAAARDLARRASAAIAAFVLTRQENSGLKPSKQIRLELVNAPERPELVEPRSKTLPVMLFLGVMSIVLFAAYVRENLDRSREVAVAESKPPAPVVIAEAPVDAVDERAAARTHVEVAGRGSPTARPTTLGTTASQSRRRQIEG